MRLLKTSKRIRKVCKSYFIVFEGGHGSGKTTQAQLLRDYLARNGTQAVYTKEPYCHDLMPLLNRYANEDFVSTPILMYLLAADRGVHTKDIASWLNEGIHVICDRYFLSSWVYQQLQRMPLALIKRTNYFARIPDITFFIHVPLNERLARLKDTRRDRLNFFLRDEQITKEQKLYEKLVERWDGNHYGKLVSIDGRSNVETTHRKVVDSLSDFLTK